MITAITTLLVQGNIVAGVSIILIYFMPANKIGIGVSVLALIASVFSLDTFFIVDEGVALAMIIQKINKYKEKEEGGDIHFPMQENKTESNIEGNGEIRNKGRGRQIGDTNKETEGDLKW